jgi:restriction system protein
MDYRVVWIAPRGRDGGLDLLAQGDPLGVHGPRIKGQVKRRAENRVSEEELRSFLSLIEPSDVGVYISLGGFTRDAEGLARRSSRRVTLIDGDGLLNLWVEHHKRLDESARELLPLKPVWFLDVDPSAE